MRGEGWRGVDDGDCGREMVVGGDGWVRKGEDDGKMYTSGGLMGEYTKSDVWMWF